MASETTTAAISQQHFQSNSNQPIRILPLHRYHLIPVVGALPQVDESYILAK